MQGIISAVRRNSLAENAGIKAGEKLCAVNGVSVHDIIELTANSLNSFNSIILCSIDDYKPIKHNKLDLSRKGTAVAVHHRVSQIGFKNDLSLHQ